MVSESLILIGYHSDASCIVSSSSCSQIALQKALTDGTHCILEATTSLIRMPSSSTECISRLLHISAPRLTNQFRSSSRRPLTVALKPCIRSHRSSDGFALTGDDEFLVLSIDGSSCSEPALIDFSSSNTSCRFSRKRLTSLS